MALLVETVTGATAEDVIDGEASLVPSHWPRVLQLCPWMKGPLQSSASKSLCNAKFCNFLIGFGLQFLFIADISVCSQQMEALLLHPNIRCLHPDLIVLAAKGLLQCVQSRQSSVSLTI